LGPKPFPLLLPQTHLLLTTTWTPDPRSTSHEWDGQYPRSSFQRTTPSRPRATEFPPPWFQRPRNEGPFQQNHGLQGPAHFLHQGCERDSFLSPSVRGFFPSVVDLREPPFFSPLLQYVCLFSRSWCGALQLFFFEQIVLVTPFLSRSFPFFRA